jgi:hypothetical protein
MNALSYESLILGNTYTFVNNRTNLNYGQRSFKGFDYGYMIGMDAGNGASCWEPIVNINVYDISVDVSGFTRTTLMPTLAPPANVGGASLGNANVGNATLILSSVENIGDLREGDGIVLKDYEEPISYRSFNDGDTGILFINPNGNIQSEQRCFVYFSENLNNWFATGNRTDPQTRIPIQQNMLRRFTYRFL